MLYKYYEYYIKKISKYFDKFSILYLEIFVKQIKILVIFFKTIF